MLIKIQGASIAAAAMLMLSAVAQAAPIIGVDIDTGNGAPMNWTAYTLADVNVTKANLVAEDGSTSSVDFLLSGVIYDQAVGVDPSLIPSHSNPLDLVAGDILYGGPNPTVALWSGLTPNAKYNYWVFVSAASIDTITATGSTVDSFLSPGVGISLQRINGIMGSATLTFASYARQVTASATGTIQIDILSLATPTPSGYAIQEVPEPASIVMGLMGAAALGAVVIRKRRARGWMM